MTAEEARALELFVKDHDTRFLAKAMEDHEGAGVLLTEPDGRVREPIRSVQAYAEHFITSATPTIQEAWAQWRPGA